MWSQFVRLIYSKSIKLESPEISSFAIILISESESDRIAFYRLNRLVSFYIIYKALNILLIFILLKFSVTARLQA